MNNKLSSLIKLLLELYPVLRDSDEKLVSIIWKEQLRNLGEDEININTFFKLLENKKLYNHDTITRHRRFIQERNPELRGEKYELQQESQTEYKKDVKESKKSDNPEFF